MIEIEEKIYEVREYSSFPEKKFFGDKLIRSFKKQEDALYESIFLNKKYPNKRYYAMDNPHEWVDVKTKDRKELEAKYGLV